MSYGNSSNYDDDNDNSYYMPYDLSGRQRRRRQQQLGDSARPDINSLAEPRESRRDDEHMLIESVRLDPRSRLSMPRIDEMDQEFRESFMSDEQKRNESLGRYNVKEFTWPVDPSGNMRAFNSLEANESNRMRLERDRQLRYYDMSRRNNRDNNSRLSGQGGHMGVEDDY